MQYEITTALGSETMEVDLKAAKKRINELNAKLITKNDQEEKECKKGATF